MTPIDSITAADAAPAGGHYSPAVGWGELVFISGQLPVGADGTHDPAAAFADQAERAIANLLAVLDASGGTPADLLKVTVYLVDVENWAEFNEVYARLIGEAKPARSVVPVPALHHGYLVEIDAIARRVVR